jgi:hypothetical protein
MNLVVTREPTADGCTIGALTLDGAIGRLGWTLEDPVREIPGQSVSSWKIAGNTAIPAGQYRVAITLSQRFGRRMPILHDVNGFEGIRIHSGNTAADTAGCLLVGLTRHGAGVYQSRAAFEPLYAKLETALLAAEEVWISVG